MATNERQISIYQRHDGINEWVGSGTIGKYGEVHCSAEIGRETYEAIERQIEDGDTEGETGDYNWQIEH